MPTESTDDPVLPAAAPQAAAIAVVRARPRVPLARRFFLQIAAVSVGLLLVAATAEGWFGWREARTQVARLQGLQAQAAAAEIEQFLRQIQQGLTQVQALPWGQVGFGARERREELHRLLALNPSLMEVVDLDGAHREELAVSRLTADRLRTGGQPPSNSSMAPGFGPIWIDTSGVPNVWLVLPRSGPGTSHSSTASVDPTGLTLAQINLRFLGDVVSGLRVADGGEVYVVDASNRLVAHADHTLVLRQRETVNAPRAVANGVTRLQAADGPGLTGVQAITTSVGLPGTQWTVFVEHPRSKALQPVAATLQRTAALLALAGLIAMATSAAFAARMAAPIARLRRATAEMAAGQLQQRISVTTNDEIQGLAEDFNTLSARLQQSYSELELKVEQRTAELALRRDEAERANAAKTRFLASASHDLRQPMHAIGLLVGVLRERLVGQDLRGLADMTHQAVQAMDGLFGSLLDISKLDAGAVQPQPGLFALQDLLDRVATSYTPLAAAKSLRLRTRPAAVMLRTDRALLERVVGNLVTNAIRYTRHGGVLVACRRRGTGWVLQVVDSGVGIASEQLDLIFEEFVRLDGTHGGDQGLGLGLAIVKRTAALLGLTIQVRSRPGHGSVFELSLPVAEALPVPVAELAVPAELRQRVSGAFVLVVDDDTRNLEATATLLQQWGCLVATAATAEAALQEAERHLRPPDVVVTDLRLGPGLHGIELIRRLRAQTGLWAPALLVTADTQLPQAVDGDTQVLQKPVGPERLLEALVQSLAGTEPL